MTKTIDKTDTEYKLLVLQLIISTVVLCISNFLRNHCQLDEKLYSTKIQNPTYIMMGIPGQQMQCPGRGQYSMRGSERGPRAGRADRALAALHTPRYCLLPYLGKIVKNMRLCMYASEKLYFYVIIKKSCFKLHERINKKGGGDLCSRMWGYNFKLHAMNNLE